eukprot:evm.model.scf_5299.1 EVM.evm.TU.scf_5299.1   scf_5299:57-2279(-)
MGVTRKQIERKIGRAADRLTAYDMGVLRVVFKSIRQGETSIDDEFPSDAANEVASALKGAEAKPADDKAAKGEAKPKDEPKAAETPPHDPETGEIKEDDAEEKARLADLAMKIEGAMNNATTPDELSAIAADNRADIEAMPQFMQDNIQKAYQAAADKLAPRSKGRRKPADKPGDMFGDDSGMPEIRGAAIYDLLMAMRYERDEAKRENVWTMLCRIASDFRAEDERNRDGRRSWMPARAVLRRMPHLNSQDVDRVAGGNGGMWTDDEVDARLFRRQKNGPWHIRDRRGKTDAKRSLRTRSKAQARIAGREWLISRDHLFSAEPRVAWSDAVLNWSGHYLPESVKESTATRYLVSEAQISLFIEAEARKRGQSDLYIDQIDVKLIMAFLRFRKAAGVAVRTRKRDLTAWADIMSSCVAEGWRDDNPVQAVDKKVVRAKHQPIVLPPMEEVRRLIEEAGPMKGRLVDLLWRTGLRLEEGTQLIHANWDKNEIRLFGDGTKTSRPRVVPLSDQQDPHWMREAAGTLAGTPRHLKSPHVFWHGDGLAFRTMSNNLKVIRKRLGFTWHTHDLRHLFAVLYLRHFMPNPRQALYRLQQIMGHASIKQTEEYLDFVGPSVNVTDIPDMEREQKREHT